MYVGEWINKLEQFGFVEITYLAQDDAQILPDYRSDRLFEFEIFTDDLLAQEVVIEEQKALEFAQDYLESLPTGDEPPDGGEEGGESEEMLMLKHENEDLKSQLALVNDQQAVKLADQVVDLKQQVTDKDKQIEILKALLMGKDPKANADADAQANADEGAKVDG